MFDDNSFFLIPKQNLIDSENKGVIELFASEQLKGLFENKKIDLISARDGKELIFKIGTEKIYTADLDLALHHIGEKKIELVFDSATHESGTLLVLENGGVFEAESNTDQSHETYVVCMDDNDYLVKNFKVL